MLRPLVLYSFLIIVVNSCFAAGPNLTESPTVRLSAGVLQGNHFGPAENEVSFLGVRYAAPPVGQLRWKPPQPAASWTGTRVASEFGSSCPQPALRWLPDLGWSEDCLFLNIWTTALGTPTKKPVIFYLHGGGNKAGRSQLHQLGPALSRSGVVFVSANYRLGPLGFLAHPSLTTESPNHSSGNYGLLDQLQALRWVRQNIAQFGGDPAQITVMGHSAGAYDICMLMTSPMAAGLFQRAILHSGDCQGTLTADIRKPLAYNSITGSGESEGERFVKDLGLKDDSDLTKKLRDLPVDVIIQKWMEDKINFDAVVDGWVIPKQPAKAFAEGTQMRIPILIGTTADEGTVFNQRARTVDEYKAFLAKDSGKYADEAFLTYPVASDSEVRARTLQFIADTFAFGANSMASSVTRGGEKAYLYYFSYSARPQFGAYHGAELMFLGDSFPVDWQRTPEADKLGEMMRNYWTQFAKTGDPNAPNLISWPAYEPGIDQVLDLGSTISVRPTPHGAQLKAISEITKKIFAETLNSRSAPRAQVPSAPIGRLK